MQWVISEDARGVRERDSLPNVAVLAAIWPGWTLFPAEVPVTPLQSSMGSHMFYDYDE